MISTYNWPKAMELVLLSALRQSSPPDEILVADDGSGPETKTLIENFQKTSNIQIRHFWQEDIGFRKAAILNKAIAVAEGEYIIQIDGDCILHRDFVKDHLACQQKNTFLYGSRVNIQKGFLPKLINKKKIDFKFWDKGIKKRTRTLRIPILAALYKANKGLSKKIRGCNISYWRKDIIAVNGYNEAFVGWGREDSEIIVRMMNNGVLGKRLRYRGIVYHIWHQIKDKGNLKQNTHMEDIAKSTQTIWCKNGIDKYLF
ncbi:MAG TPA: glycosyltransferase family 2 protein [Flavobacteriaceae bacterium]|nr:glycosyltransferase family 2 protein [Flavobacteriaceae bacterium]